MWRLIAIGSVIALPFFASLQDAKAQRRYSTSMTAGTCPIGPCAMNGGPKARNVKNCSPANCRKNGTK